MLQRQEYLIVELNLFVAQSIFGTVQGKLVGDELVIQSEFQSPAPSDQRS